ncbi:flavohemoprotein [Streptomyces sp. BHT-5-2]|uniref:globin domain-containing protein n=1 Tax=Streptomyces sp. BHT-5-2 TaxID=2866715 RepID=UPI001C8DC2A4|nr:globin domain-containing protein [Streptomyces sp. BHT-5-2]QZL05094.1 flavohemoprotein [Streptomyces sp. BHT-5-2]
MQQSRRAARPAPSVPSARSAPGTVGGEYHALLARHDAMRLRRQILGQRTAPAPDLPAAAYDGAADQRLITQYLDLVTPFGDLIAHLYDEMFARWPYLRSLFPASMEFQRAHLARAFWYLIENLHRPGEVAAYFRQLGHDHRKLGVRPVHFEAFEISLCAALRRTAGPRWAEAVEEAWVRMLRFAVASMVEGADAALAEPPCWQGTVTSHERRRPDLAVLRLRVHEPYPYRAGQYAAVESPLMPQAWRHYSLASAPRPDGEVEFHVRRTGPGGVSEALVDGTDVGDTLRLGPAHGTMTLQEADHPRDLLLVAGGTGWAPVKALLEEWVARRRGTGGRSLRPAGRVRLFVGARSRAELYDAEALSQFATRQGRLRVVRVLDDEAAAATDGSPGEYGALAEAVARGGAWSGQLAFVSGPAAMVGATVARLTAAGMPADRIRHDPVPDLMPASGGCPAAYPADGAVTGAAW